MFAFWFGSKCGCGGAKQIVWRDTSGGSWPPSPPNETGYSPFRPIVDTYTIAYNGAYGSSSVTSQGWVNGGVMLAGSLVAIVRTFTTPGVYNWDKFTDLYEAAEDIPAGAGNPASSSRFRPVGLVDANDGYMLYPHQGYNPATNYQPGTIVASGHLCQVAPNGYQFRDLPYWNLYSLRRNLFKQRSFGPYTRQTETTSWTFTKTPGGEEGQTDLRPATGSVSRSFELGVATQVGIMPTIEKFSWPGQWAQDTNLQVNWPNIPGYCKHIEITESRQHFVFTRLVSGGPRFSNGLLEVTQTVELS